ncbi:type VI secretion system contractile sheath small subunit [uncultured Maribacter sp.]|uniref:type VI secretion system contractile sheath small subunit n=1 Tax=uncultured Maribacter sp. TaxID=431308 RepID=UPI0026108E98|nr:type VI secretion system contractile sheath small subunit [uncultured Maribacter sp.]
MSDKTYGLGGTEVKRESIESLQEIPQNRTIFVEKLTQNQPLRPEMAKGLKTIDDVFNHYKPNIELAFEDSEGMESKTTLNFNNLGDFGKKGIVNQSEFLKDLDTEKDQYLKVIKQLKTNKILKAALSDPDAKEALLNTIQDLISELETK